MLAIELDDINADWLKNVSQQFNGASIDHIMVGDNGDCFAVIGHDNRPIGNVGTVKNILKGDENE